MKLFLICSVVYLLHLGLSMLIDLLSGFSVRQSWINQFAVLNALDAGEMIVMALTLLILIATFFRKTTTEIKEKIHTELDNNVEQQKSGQ